MVITSKKKYCCTHIIILTLVPYSVIHNLKLGDRLVILYSSKFWIICVSIIMRIFGNFINSCNVEVPHCSSVAEFSGGSGKL